MFFPKFNLNIQIKLGSPPRILRGGRRFPCVNLRTCFATHKHNTIQHSNTPQIHSNTHNTQQYTQHTNMYSSEWTVVQRGRRKKPVYFGSAQGGDLDRRRARVPDGRARAQGYGGGLLPQINPFNSLDCPNSKLESSAPIFPRYLFISFKNTLVLKAASQQRQTGKPQN